jgi:hypothetical protein
MKKVKELKEGTNLTKVKVKLPENVLKEYENYYGGQPEMFIAGSMMGDFFLSPNKPGNKNRKLYPMPANAQPSDILDWEVVEILE